MSVAAGVQPLVAPAIKSFVAKYATGSHDPVDLQRLLTLFDMINPRSLYHSCRDTGTPLCSYQ